VFIAAGVNRPDALQRAGHLSTAAGCVAAYRTGDFGRGCRSGSEGVPASRCWARRYVPWCATGGGYAQYVALSKAGAVPARAGRAMTLIEAAALPETLFTVWHNLFERAICAWTTKPFLCTVARQRHRHHDDLDLCKACSACSDHRYLRKRREMRAQRSGAGVRRMPSITAPSDLCRGSVADHGRQGSRRIVFDMVAWRLCAAQPYLPC
jgi:hypothetical protein